MDGDGRNDLYMECLRNHAASLGSYATDGCGEFTADDDASPGNLQCAACGCHRNFHRKLTCCSSLAAANDSCGRNAAILRDGGRVDLAGAEGERRPESPRNSDRRVSGGCAKKRFRTKFTAEQKAKMLGFAEKLGWKLQRKDVEDEIERFCKGVGVSRQVFKVWMHNHKNSPSSSSTSTTTATASALTQY